MGRRPSKPREIEDQEEESEVKGRVTCAERCSLCNNFGVYQNQTKAEGHYRGIFVCKKCRDEGFSFDNARKQERE